MSFVYDYKLLDVGNGCYNLMNEFAVNEVPRVAVDECGWSNIELLARLDINIEEVSSTCGICTWLTGYRSDNIESLSVLPDGMFG